MSNKIRATVVDRVLNPFMKKTDAAKMIHRTAKGRDRRNMLSSVEEEVFVWHFVAVFIVVSHISVSTGVASGDGFEK